MPKLAVRFAESIEGYNSLLIFDQADNANAVYAENLNNDQIQRMYDLIDGKSNPGISLAHTSHMGTDTIKVDEWRQR